MANICRFVLDKPVCFVLYCRPSWLPTPGVPSSPKLLVHHLPAPRCSWGCCHLPSPKPLSLHASPIPHPVPLCFCSSGSFRRSSPSSLSSFHSLPSQYQDALSIPPFLHKEASLMSSLSSAPFHSALPWGLGRRAQMPQQKMMMWR